MMTTDAEHLRAMATQAIRNDTGAWFENYGRIWAKDRTQGLVKPRMNHLQSKIQKTIRKLEDMNLPVRLLGLKPRARGSTTFFTAQGYTIMRRVSTSAAFIGGQSDQTVGLWNMLKTYKENDAFQWNNTGEINEKGAHFSNGSRAKKETARDVQAGIGDTYQVLHCTEAARWAQYGVANATEVMANILKAVPRLPNTYVFLESTAEGQSGDFYERYVRATEADDFLDGKVVPRSGDYLRVFAAWFEFEESAIRLTPEEKLNIERTLDQEPRWFGEREMIELYGNTREDGVRRLGEVVEDYDIWEQLAFRRYAIDEECGRSKENFDRDYPHSWRTAFQKSGSQRFSPTGIGQMRRRAAKITSTHGVLEDNGRRLAFRQTSDLEATVTVFEKPKAGMRYLLSVDPMTGETQVGGKDPDRHGAFVMRAGYWNAKREWQRMATAARIVPSRWDIDILELNIWLLAQYYGGKSGCLIAIEMNMDRGLTELLKLRGANLYQRRMFNQRDNRMTKALGFQTNERTRENLIEKLARHIREWDVAGEGIDIHCPHAIAQCENFVRKANGRSEHASGWHDDDVLAIALGTELIEQATTMPPDTATMNPFALSRQPDSRTRVNMYS